MNPSCGVADKAERPGNEARNETGKAKVGSSNGADHVKRRDGGKESEVGRVAVFIPCGGQPLHTP
jgi:hypothetical protein